MDENVQVDNTCSRYLAGRIGAPGRGRRSITHSDLMGGDKSSVNLKNIQNNPETDQS